MTVPLILVPGLMCDATVWQPLLPALGALADCQVADHGDADSITKMARRVLEQAPPQFALAGHSMGGREDSWAPVAQHEEISALIPRHAVLSIVEQAGHMSPMEQPQPVAQAMLTWLRAPGT